MSLRFALLYSRTGQPPIPPHPAAAPPHPPAPGALHGSERPAAARQQISCSAVRRALNPDDPVRDATLFTSEPGPSLPRDVDASFVYQAGWCPKRL
jgi:hypothetical protein